MSRVKALSDYETGEPPRGEGRPIFAESLSTYTKSGTHSTEETKRFSPKHVRGEGFDVPLSPEELAWVEERRALVPSFDALVRGEA